MLGSPKHHICALCHHKGQLCKLTLRCLQNVVQCLSSQPNCGQTLHFSPAPVHSLWFHSDWPPHSSQLKSRRCNTARSQRQKRLSGLQHGIQSDNKRLCLRREMSNEATGHQENRRSVSVIRVTMATNTAETFNHCKQPSWVSLSHPTLTSCDQQRAPQVCM